MANGQLKTNSRMPSAERMVAIAVCLLLLWPLVECGLPFVISKQTDHFLAGANSPDGKWTAIVSRRIYAGTFSGSEFVVKLSGSSSKEIFIIEEDAVNQPLLKWQSYNELVIRANGQNIKTSVAHSVELQLKEYEGIKIVYDIR